MFFTTDFISGCLKKSGFEKTEIIEREPYPGVEYESRRAYVFARKKFTIIVPTRLMQPTQNKRCRLATLEIRLYVDMFSLAL